MCNDREDRIQHGHRKRLRQVFLRQKANPASFWTKQSRGRSNLIPLHTWPFRKAGPEVRGSESEATLHTSDSLKFGP